MKKRISLFIIILLVLSISIIGCSSNIVNKEEQSPENPKPEPDKVQIDTGRYSGRIDNNFIEIKVSGVPDQLAAREYMISEEIKNSFEALNLKTNEEIKIKYLLTENNQRLIVEIIRI